MKVLVCGAGNGAQALTGIASSQPDCEVRVLTLFADEAERWTSILVDNELTITRPALDKEGTEVIKTRPTMITKDASKAVPDSELIILVVPSFAHTPYLEALKSHIQPGTVLIGLPGHGGFEYEVRSILGDVAKHVTLMSFESTPWPCRIIEWGKHVAILGNKSSLLGSVQMGATPPPKNPTEMFQQALGKHPTLTTRGHILGIGLMGINGYFHPSLMYERWHDWDGKPMDTAPLFHHGINKSGCELMCRVSDEVVAIANKVTQLRPQVDMSNVQHLYDWYCRTYDDVITDKSSLETIVKNIRAYDGLTHPMKSTPDGKFVPDFNSRYLKEDIPYGLAVFRGVALILGVPTPNMDKIILWAQTRLDMEFIAEDGAMTGKDVSATRCPQRYGISDIDSLLGL